MSSSFGQTITNNHKRIYFSVNAEPWNIYALIDKKIQIKTKLILQNVYQIPLEEGNYDMRISTQGEIISTVYMSEVKRRFGRRDRFYHNHELEKFKTDQPISFTAVGVPTPNSYWLQNGMYLALTPAVRAIYQTTKFDDAGYPCYYVESDIRHYNKDYLKELSHANINN